MRAELIFALALLAVPAAARPRAPKALPAADAMLTRAFSAPAKNLLAHGRVQSFAPGKKPKSVGTTVYWGANGKRRWEVRKSPRKPALLTSIDDGATTTKIWPKLNAVWAGPSTHESAQEQVERLHALFDVRVSTGGRVAKRRTWRIDLLASDGRLRRSLWVDREDGLLLKRESYRLGGGLSRRERVLRLEDLPSDPDLFHADAAGALPLNVPRGAAAPVRVPRWVPDGYIPLEVLAEGGRVVLSYGDGRSTFTVSESRASGGARATGRTVTLKRGVRASLTASGETQTLARRSGADVDEVSGELAEDDLARVMDSLPEAAP